MTNDPLTGTCADCFQPCNPGFTRCLRCSKQARKEARETAPTFYAPQPTCVHWPTLIERAERRGIPVLRVDDNGRAHIIRTVAQLETEWEPTNPAPTEGAQKGTPA